jgi:hypothetical protein
VIKHTDYTGCFDEDPAALMQFSTRLYLNGGRAGITPGRREEGWGTSSGGGLGGVRLGLGVPLAAAPPLVYRGPVGPLVQST